MKQETVSSAEEEEQKPRLMRTLVFSLSGELLKQHTREAQAELYCGLGHQRRAQETAGFLRARSETKCSEEA